MSFYCRILRENNIRITFMDNPVRVTFTASDMCDYNVCVASHISRSEGFTKTLKMPLKMAHGRLLFACLSGPVCLCAIISHQRSVQTELWAAQPPRKTDSTGPREILSGPVPMQSDVIHTHTHTHTCTHTHTHPAPQSKCALTRRRETSTPANTLL